VFVLKEVFDYSYAEIARAADRSEAAVRQAASRAAGMCRPGGLGLLRTGKRCRPQPSGSFAAATGADINVLMELLAPDVTLWTDGGGKVRQAMRPIDGAAKVAASFTGALRRPTKGSGSQA
jgi:hypothetical protein